MVKTRSNDKGKTTAQEVEALQKQLEVMQNKLKRQNEENGDSSEDQVVPKKAKAEIWKPFAVTFHESEAEKIKKSMRKWVIPEVKFLANDEEGKACLKIALMMTNHYTDHGLDKLTDDQFDRQIEEYWGKYGKVCVRQFVNTQRNQLAQALRKVVLKLYEEGREFSAGQLMSVITRNPNLLLMKPTKFKEGDPKAKEKEAANKEVNEANKKYRARFLCYIDEFIPAATPAGIWGEQQRNQHMLFCCQHMVAGELKDVVPVEEEAMILVMLENNEEKWSWQSMVMKEKQMNIEDYKKSIGYEEFYEQQPASLYSDAEGGNNKYGGWSEKGVLRFAEVRDMIKEARKNKDCRKVEQQFQKLLERKCPIATRKRKAKGKKVVAPQARTSVAFGGGGAKKKGGKKAPLHAVGYDSEEEAKKLKAVRNFDVKKEGKKKKKEGKKKKKKGKAKTNEAEVQSEDDGEPIDQTQVAGAMESSAEEDDDLIKGGYYDKLKEADPKNAAQQKKQNADEENEGGENDE